MKIKRHKYTSSHWGTYAAKRKGNNKISLSPFEKDKDPSIIGYGIEDILDNKNRIRMPMIRKGWLESKDFKPFGFRFEFQAQGRGVAFPQDILCSS